MDRYATWLSLLYVSGSVLLAHTSHVAGSTTIRGVPLAMRSMYSPSREFFECLDGSMLIPFSNVNDNYCDCADASDEPGTSACGNGIFYCENAGHQPHYVPSSWVNDGVCDCCDASDEYDYPSESKCQNTCHILAKEAKLVQQKAEQQARDGNKVRLEMVSKGKAIKAEYRSQLVKLRASYEEAELMKKEKEILKAQTEEREKLALEKYKPAEPVTEEESLVASETRMLLIDPELEKCFRILDENNDGTLTLHEVEQRVLDGKNIPSSVTVHDSKYVLFGQLAGTWDEFLSMAREKEHHEVKLAVEKIKAIAGYPIREISDDEGEEGEEDEGDIGEREEEETESDAEAEAETGVEKETEDTIQYDEETQALIDEANSARERLQEAEKAVSELQSEINQLEVKLRHNYGPDDEFASLHGECFEYTDMEYIYKLCLYDKATQRSKSHGGSEVNLGQFNRFVGPTGNKFSRMEYDKGLTCWNGPPRSTLVTLSCGTETKLISVTEPSRCEYAMELTTPALCRTDSIETADAQQTPDVQQTLDEQPTSDEQHAHDEL
ncbi:PREDICTED: glucosidase 2 subunit beta [Dinoponera quadriceps]|uniref:Glucosidase 2 subunit beta n=1 Tax=Dinoponera quadriceps TaxID=609295 RepID=A0A6P3WNT2_DINQU|nr:PREDICTED: glucosidase 2 subunit beta [Dinoponera quadriceps]